MFALLLIAGISPAQLACGGCHDQARAYARSTHATAFSNPGFQASWIRGGRDPWCAGCHAPSGGSGIGCESCHGALRGGSWGTEGALTCQGCHEFAFPAPRAKLSDPVVPLPVLMQSTVSEGSGGSCLGCHMPGGDHGFPGTALAPGSLKVSAELAGGGLRLTLTTRGAGHAVPTGDPFRRLRVSVCADRACEIAVDAVELGRRWRRRGERIEALSDTRPRPGHPAVVVFEEAAPFWRVELILSEAGLPERSLHIAGGEIP